MDNGAMNYCRFLEGDDDGFVAIVRDYKDGLMLYLNSFVNNIYVAEELTEDTFVKLGIKRPKYIAKASFKTWLYAIGRNTAIDYIRKNNKYREVPLDDYAHLACDESDIERAYIKEEEKRMLYQAMKRLSSSYQQVLWLVYFEGFSHKQVARIMKKSVHSVETLVYRARISLKVELEKEGFGDEKL